MGNNEHICKCGLRNELRCDCLLEEIAQLKDDLQKKETFISEFIECLEDLETDYANGISSTLHNKYWLQKAKFLLGDITHAAQPGYTSETDPNNTGPEDAA